MKHLTLILLFSISVATFSIAQIGVTQSGGFNFDLKSIKPELTALSFDSTESYFFINANDSLKSSKTVYKTFEPDRKWSEYNFNSAFENSDDPWLPQNENNYTFEPVNDGFLLTGDLYYGWSSDLNRFTTHYVHKGLFSKDTLQLDFEEYTEQEDGSLELGLRYEYTYNELNLNDTFRVFSYDADLDKLKLSSIYVNQYIEGEDRLQFEFYYQVNEAGEARLENRTDYFYDERDLDTLQLQYTFDDDLQDLALNRKIRKMYNEDGQLTYEERSFAFFGEFQFSSGYAYYHNPAGKIDTIIELDLIIEDHYDTDSSEFVIDTSYYDTIEFNVFGYDEKDQLISLEYFLFNPETEEWGPYYEEYITLSAALGVSSQFYGLDYFTKLDLFYDPDDLIYDPILLRSRDYYYLTQDITPVQELSTFNDRPAMVIYPNPANSSINIKKQNISGELFIFELFDSAGKRLMKGQSSNQIETINIAELPPGNYYIRTIDNTGQHASNRFIKQ